MVQDLEQQREELVEKLEQKELSKEKEASVWQTIADIQRQQRLQTEQENRQLKEALEQQLQMAKRLEEGVRKKRASEVVLTRPFDQKRSRLDHTMALLYSQHMRDIHRGYNQLDEIFEWANGIEHLESPVIGSRLDEHGLHQPYVELRERRWVPYEFSRVCGALWQATVSEYLRTREGVEAHCEPDSLVIRYDNINHKPERDGLLVGTVVMKKFMEPNRMILVWRGTTTAVEEQVDVWRRPFSDETGWVLVERDPESDTPATRSRTCSRHYAQWDPESGESTKRTPTRLRAEDFEKLVLGSTLDDMACIVEAFENILLDEDALSKH
ncbi:hypothetical protein Poli38472_004981 [Pythium oligandrum]|uniref:Uncharacterized protein n=1 Tax=Pythium oligandrum TaxID=41045 RepID=A0A8K1FHM6_PYTOL|nr:hypothetical protein Poli38472_004981 [Pythium oligandrum]|eukprot:TMW59912.1 hypothetical protein Poli38472_004981 [Pythium oligandrum]